MIKIDSKKVFMLLILTLCSVATWTSNAAAQTMDDGYPEGSGDHPEEQPTLKVNVSFATLSEAKDYISTNDDFLRSLNQANIDMRLGKTGGTKDELITLMQNECLEFTEEDKEKVTSAFNQVIEMMNAGGFVNLQVPENIVFVKTTMKEEMQAGAYTRNGIIYIGDKTINSEMLQHILAHEFFHVLTHEYKNFRRSIYSVIGFNVTSYMRGFQSDVKDRIVCNPDACTYDSYATFTINGEQYPCVLVAMLNDTYKIGDDALDHMETCLIPLEMSGDFWTPMTEDGKTIVYTEDQVSDFYGVMGNNTTYAFDPEECLAENFVMTILNETEDVFSPEIIDKIKEQICINYEPVNPDPEPTPEPGTYDIKRPSNIVFYDADLSDQNISTTGINWKDRQQVTSLLVTYLPEYASSDTFENYRTNTDIKGFTHYDCKQTAEGKVTSGDIIAHVDSNGKLMYLTGQLFNHTDINYGGNSSNEETAIYAKGRNKAKAASKADTVDKADTMSKLLVNAAAQPRKAAIGTDSVNLDADPYFYGREHLKVAKTIGSKDDEGNYILQIPDRLYTLNFTNNVLMQKGINSIYELQTFNDYLSAGDNFTSKTADFAAESDGIKSNLSMVVAMIPETVKATGDYNLEIKKCKYADLEETAIDPADIYNMIDMTTIGLNNECCKKYLMPAIRKGTQMGIATGQTNPESAGVCLFQYSDVIFSTPCREKDTSNEVDNNFYAMVLTNGNDTIACTTYKLTHSDERLLVPCMQNANDTIEMRTYHNLIAYQPAIGIHWGLERVLDTYENTFGINSFDGKGTPVVAMVNYNDFQGSAMNAAASPDTPFDKTCGVMQFGMGQFFPYLDKTYNISNFGFYPYSMLDLTGHEFTHLVATKLGDDDETAALNESYADIMGKMIERKSLQEYSYPSGDDYVEFVSWKLGQVNGYGTPQYVVRRFNDPNTDSHPKFYQGNFWQSENADMHANAGVQNYWFYLLCNGGTVTPEQGEDVTIEAIPRDSAELITFSSLMYYGLKYVDYPMARKNSIYAARMYFGDDSQEVKSVFNAWYAVGVGQDEWKPGDPTSLNAIINDNKFCASDNARKYLDNGRIVILKNGTKYNVNGQRMK